MVHQLWSSACASRLKRLVIFIVLGSTMSLSACGGGGGSSSSSNNPTTTPVSQPVSGLFIDSAVAGLSYSCSSGKSGVTDTNGTYTCNKGDTVTFSINGYVIGSASASDVITPETLTTNTEQAVNVAQLLQTLDADGDPSNGISIAQSGSLYDAMATMASDNVSLADASFDTTAAGILGVTSLVDATTAQNHLNDSIASLSFTKADIIAFFAGKTVYPNKSTPMDSEDWVMASDGLSATSTGVDQSGPYSGSLTFSYTDTSFTVSSAADGAKTFTVTAITSDHLETNLGNIYYSQAKAYTDAIVAAFAGKQVYPQRPSTDYTMEWAFDVAGAATTITCTEPGNNCSGNALTTYSGSAFSITITDKAASDYGVPYTFTVVDIVPGEITIIDQSGALGFGAGAQVGIFTSQQAAYSGSTSSLTCNTNSGQDVNGAPVTAYSFADFETIVSDCNATTPIISAVSADIQGKTLTNSVGTTFAFDTTASTPTAASPATGTYTETGGATAPITWYVEPSTNGLYNYVVIHFTIGGTELRATSAVLAVSGTAYTLKEYIERSDYSDMVRANGADGDVELENVTLQ